MLCMFDIKMIMFTLVALSMALNGCKSTNESCVIDTVEFKISTPEFVVNNLHGDALLKYKTILSTAPLPEKIPYIENSDKYKLYILWYQRGYAYGWLSGCEHIRSQAWEKNANRRAILAGWYGGNSQASLAFELNKIMRLPSVANSQTAPSGRILGSGINNKLYESEHSKTNRMTEAKQERIKSIK